MDPIKKGYENMSGVGENEVQLDFIKSKFWLILKLAKLEIEKLYFVVKISQNRFFSD